MPRTNSAAGSERILICAPFGRDGALLERELRRDGFLVLNCPSVEVVSRELETGAGAVLIADQAFAKPLALQQFSDALAHQPPWSETPVLVMTASAGNARQRQRVNLRLELLGKFTLLERPLRPATLVSSLRAALRARRQQYLIRDHLGNLELRELALKESQERYRSLAEQVADGIFVADSQGRYIDANQPALDMLGYTREELLRLTFLDLLHPSELNRLPEQLEKLASGHFIQADWKFVRKDGSVFIGDLIGRQLPDGRYQSLVRDVTERRQSEDRLKQVEERQSYLLALSDALRPLSDPEEIQMTASRLLGEHLKANRVLYAEINGGVAVVHRDYVNGVPSIAGRFQLSDFGEQVITASERGELLNLPDVPNDASLPGHVRTAFAAIQGISNLSRSLIKDGRWVASLVVQQAVPRVWTELEISLVEETAERTWAAVERAGAAAALRQSQQDYAALVRASAQIVWTANPDGSITEDSPSWREFTGQSYDEWKGFGWVDPIHPDDIGRIKVQWQETVQAKALLSAEFRVRHRTGGWRWLSARAVPILDAQGNIQKWIGMDADVTERKLAEERERAAVAKFEAVFHQSGIFAAVLDITGRMIEVNDLAVDLCGYTRDQAIGKLFWETPWWRGSEEVRERLRQAVRRAAHGEAMRDILPYRFADGAERIVEFAMNPIRDHEGVVRFLNPTGIDITERKQAEQALRDSEATLRAFYDNSPLYMGVTELGDGDVFHVYNNPATCRFFGMESDATAGKWALTELSADPNTVRTWSECYRISERTGEPVQFEHPAAGPGGIRWLSATVAPIGKGPTGRTRFCFVAEDITTRKHAEVALRDSEERFRTLADNMSQFAWMTDANGWASWHNHRWYDYTGTNPEQMVGWGWQMVVHPEHLDRVVRHLRHCFETGEPWEDTFPIRGRDGEYRWFLSRALPIRDEKASIVRWFGTNTDVTEQLKTEAELRRANQDLEQFAYSASHDLQEPLRNVVVYSQLLQREYSAKLDAKADRFLNNIIGGARRMGNLVSDLLEYSRAGVPDDTPVPVTEAEAVFAQVVTALGRAIKENRAQVTHSHLPAIYMRPTHLHQLFQNLLSNAMKYRKDNVAPHVEVRAEALDGVWQFSVSDNGMGIEPEYHEKIFGVFKRLHGGTEKYAGTGIGLAICQRIVEQYGGRIWVQSEAGSGSTFYFTVPRRES